MQRGLQLKVASNAAVDPDDLGLVVTPFEQAFDMSAPVTVELDDSPFDPEAELERAKRIVSIVRYSDGHVKRQRLAFAEPLFDKMPSAAQIDWWVDYLAGLRDPKLLRQVWRGEDPDWPIWLRAVLRRSWRGPLSAIASRQPQVIGHAFPLRALLGIRPAEAVARARTNLRAPIPAPIARNGYGSFELVDVTAYEAAALDALAPDVARELLAEVPNNAPMNYWADESLALAGLILPTVAERVAFARRTGAMVSSWDGVVPWLVATGREGFGLLTTWLDKVDTHTAQEMLQVAAETGHGPGMTELFLDALDTKAGAVAMLWLRGHLPQALVAHVTRPQAQALAPLLRELTPEELRQAAEQATEAVREIIDQVLAEAGMPELPADTPWWAEATEVELPKAQSLPLSIKGLPPIKVDGQHRLGTDQVQLLLQALSAADQHPLTAAVREHADRASRDQFALSLFLLWLSAGAPSRQSWLMTGGGWLGDGAFIAALAPRIREWPGVSQHQRAVKGLTALRNVATDTALQQISGIAAKVKFAGIKKRAGEAMDEIAAQRGLTRDALEDRVLSDGGLDARGTRVFDYGPRQFLAFVTPEGKLAARRLDAEHRPTGKVLSTLPAPNKSDDQELAKASKAEYNVVKKAVTTLAKVQLTRFERAMVLDRRWTPTEHARFIAPHPVLRRLLAGLIWGIYDGATLVSAVRVDEEGLLVDAQDEPVEVGTHSIGVAHRLDLSDAQQAEWAEVLADYEIVPPFKQLDRPVFSLPATQGDDVKLRDLPAGSFPATKFIGAFTKYGWERGAALDAGSYCLHGLPIPSASLTVIIQYANGMWMGPMAEQEDQRFEQVYALRGIHDPKDLGWGRHWNLKGTEFLPWRQVPAKIVSEVLATIDAIAN
ncbi:MAG: DUF4132 domain-containing protein [Propionibacteriaceae bacterium]|nr:DUF4132 domain-containing protein [Propionibacteriaceae bacterium]